MPATSDVDTIRILVATDNHVGYNERDPIRGDDSWKSFHEIMCLAKDRDVDMVLLSGDLFHDNKPSRKSMYQVMRTLRMNCYGEKPCELEVLSDVSSNLQGSFNHVNYEDPDINVAIPVFSIHGNHDDPSGEGHLCALDLLQVAGLVNYFGRAPESDNITISPILLQKGTTKLALYGLSNVRDERLYRTFRDKKVKFLRPGTQMDDWFNLMCVHQNHHARTETGYLPENFLQEFLDLVIWGHEHDCYIEPKVNPEMGFSVIQPGSSVATSLSEAETLPKHVCILSVVGKKFTSEPIRLRTVRPFVLKDVTLRDSDELRKVANRTENRAEVSQYLVKKVEQCIAKAKRDWISAQIECGADEPDESEVPLPLIRLRVDYNPPDKGGGNFEIENPQRFSNRFVGKVANTNDVVQFVRRNTPSAARRGKDGDVMTEADAEALMQQYAGNLDKVRVEALVREFLTSQSLNILPQNALGDAVSQFIDKGDIHAVETFVSDSLETQFKKVLEYNCKDEDDIVEAMSTEKSKLEELHAKGEYKQTLKKKKTKHKERPSDWDTDLDGEFDPDDVSGEDEDVSMQDSEEDSSSRMATLSKGAAAKGGRTTKAATKSAAASKATAKKPTKAAAPKKAPAKGRGKKQVEESEEEEIVIEDSDDDDDDGDVILMDDDVEAEDLPMMDDSAEEIISKKTTTLSGRKTAAPEKLGATAASKKAATKQAAPKAAAAKTPAPKAAATRSSARKAATKAAPKTRQSTLNFSQSQARPTSSKNVPSDDDIEEDEDSDDFAPAVKTRRR